MHIIQPQCELRVGHRQSIRIEQRSTAKHTLRISQLPEAGAAGGREAVRARAPASAALLYLASQAAQRWAPALYSEFCFPPPLQSSTRHFQRFHWQGLQMPSWRVLQTGEL